MFTMPHGYPWMHVAGSHAWALEMVEHLDAVEIPRQN